MKIKLDIEKVAQAIADEIERIQRARIFRES